MSSVAAAVFLGLVVAAGIYSAPVSIPVLVGFAVVSFVSYVLKMGCKFCLDFMSNNKYLGSTRISHAGNESIMTRLKLTAFIKIFRNYKTFAPMASSVLGVVLASTGLASFIIMAPAIKSIGLIAALTTTAFPPLLITVAAVAAVSLMVVGLGKLILNIRKVNKVNQVEFELASNFAPNMLQKWVYQMRLVKRLL